MSVQNSADAGAATSGGNHGLQRAIIVGIIAFLTLIDLFATQAILPTLTRHYGVSPADMALAVNASTVGMAVASLAVALLSRRINRRTGIVVSLSLLALPTLLLANAPDLTIFTALRVVQGLLMATAFTLTLAYLGEELSMEEAPRAFAAYITGNVASNLIGRLLSASLADHFGLATNFYVFAGLNLLGAGLALLAIHPAMRLTGTEPLGQAVAAVRKHFSNPLTRSSFLIGFCILFVFIGTFSFVNFVLVRPPLSIGQMSIGFVYLVFLPSIVTTPLAGKLVAQLGTRTSLLIGLGAAALGQPLLLTGNLAAVLLGLSIIGVGTFFAQATATGLASRAADGDKGAASGIYLACYFSGGLAGSAILGQIFDRFGWTACVAAMTFVLAIALWISFRLAPAAKQ